MSEVPFFKYVYKMQTFNTQISIASAAQTNLSFISYHNLCQLISAIFFSKINF